MGIFDFMTEGQPIQAQPYASTTQNVLPDWYTNYAMDILSQQRAVANRPFSMSQGPRIADFTPDQQAGFQATRQGAMSFRPALDMASQQTQGAFGRSALGAAQPLMGQAAGMSGVDAAQPFLGQAAQTAPQVVGQYMNPYQDAVVNRIGEVGARTLREQILPGIEGAMIRAGQFGGTRQAELTGRGIRDTMEGISAQQAQALQQGYGQAQQAAQTDLSRQAALASTAGGLTQAQQQILADLGARTGQLYGADTSTQLSAAQQMGALGQQRQAQELTGAGALQQVGALQQGQTQRNLDLAEADRREQFAYPQQQLGAMSQTLAAVAPAVPQAKLQQGYGAPGQDQTYAPGALQAGVSTVTGLAGAFKALKDAGIF